MFNISFIFLPCGNIINCPKWIGKLYSNWTTANCVTLITSIIWLVSWWLTTNSKTFEFGKTPIYYSGPYWDNKETEAAIYAFLNSKWITAGENVHKFEKKFSKKINVKHSHMLNSGSSANLILMASLKKIFKWSDGDEIIVSTVGFPTTIYVIS